LEQANDHIDGFDGDIEYSPGGDSENASWSFSGPESGQDYVYEFAWIASTEQGNEGCFTAYQVSTSDKTVIVDARSVVSPTPYIIATEVPEPGAFALMAPGLLGWRRWRKR